MNTIPSTRVDVIFADGRFCSYSVIVDEFSDARYDPVDYTRRMLFSLGICDALVMIGS